MFGVNIVATGATYGKHGKRGMVEARISDIAAMRSAAAATIWPSPSVVFKPPSSVGASQCASANSSLSEISPRDPARRERQNDEMPLDAACGIARDGLAKADQLDRRDIERGFLADFADHGLFQRFAELDAAAGQRIEAMGRRPRPAHDQHPAVAEYGGADGEIRPRWISPRAFAAAH